MFSRLPPELVLHTFALAASSSRDSALALCLVASWARNLALRFLLANVILHTSEAVMSFESFISRPPLKPPSPAFHYSSLVRSLWLPTASVSHYFVGNIVSLCDNLTDLALTDLTLASLISFTQTTDEGAKGGLRSGAGIRLTLLETKLNWRIIATALGAVPAPARSPVYDMVTRLWFTDAWSYEVQLQIQHFSRLTHLALPFTLTRAAPAAYPFADIEGCLSSFPSLECLVLVLYVGEQPEEVVRTIEAWVKRVRKDDGRLFLWSICRDNLQDQWKEDFEGDSSVWEKAAAETRVFDATARQILSSGASSGE